MPESCTAMCRRRQGGEPVGLRDLDVGVLDEGSLSAREPSRRREAGRQGKEGALTAREKRWRETDLHPEVVIFCLLNAIQGTAREWKCRGGDVRNGMEVHCEAPSLSFSAREWRFRGW